MIRWLQNNPLGLGLASFCAVMLVLAVLLAVVRALPPAASGIDADDPENIASLDLPTLRDAGEIDDYDEIITRPLFNESRQPVLDTGEDSDVGDEQLVEEVDAPDVELAGVIITPSLRMATLKERGQEQSLVAFVGRPLDGDYGSWQITSIEPREVTLTSGEGKELQLKLQVHSAKMAAPPKAPMPSEETAAEQEADADTLVTDNETQPLSRAEEIRQRIAERREELKRAAEAEETEAPVSYQQAIQNMIGKKRQDNPNNDQKQ